MEERLQKLLAQAGLASRRASEELIFAGRVRVNGKVAVIGQKADPARDRIEVDGRVLQAPEQKVYIALHKPRFVLTTVEPETGDTRPTVLDLVPVSERVFPVGRLDFESEGLVLLTNDGELAQKLTHPRYGHEKEYKVLLARHPDPEQLDTWRRGVVLEDGYKTQPAQVRVETFSGKGAWVRVLMREGRKRQIREIGATLGLPIVRIIRLRIGSLILGTLKPKEWRYLTPAEVTALARPAASAAPRRFAPAAGSPHQPKPAQPKSGQPKPAQPKSGQPKSGQPKPAQPKSGQPKPAQPKRRPAPRGPKGL